MLELLNAQGNVTTHDLEHDIVLQAESPDDVRWAARELESEGLAIVLRETMAPRGLDFTGLVANRR
jgi:hypothetical protein